MIPPTTRLQATHPPRPTGPPRSHTPFVGHNHIFEIHNAIELGVHNDEHHAHSTTSPHSSSARKSLLLLTLTAITQVLALFFSIAVAHHAFASSAPVRHMCIATCATGLVSGCWLIVHIVHAKWRRYHPEHESPGHSSSRKRSRCGSASVWVARVSVFAVLVPTVISVLVLCKCVSAGFASHLTLCASWSTGLWTTQLLLISFVNVCTSCPQEAPQTRLRPIPPAPLLSTSAFAHAIRPCPTLLLNPLTTRVSALIIPSPPTAHYETCSICLDDFQPTEMLYRLPCGHLFHATCASPWLATSQMCPNCKQPALEDLVSPMLCQRPSEQLVCLESS